jgi:hypothetical protein
LVALKEHQVFVLTDRMMPVGCLDPAEKLTNRTQVSGKGNETDAHPGRQ